MRRKYMEKLKCFLAAACLAWFIVTVFPCTVYAVELDDYDYNEIDESLSEYDIDFEELIGLVME